MLKVPVSVLISVYFKEKPAYFRACLESLLAQDCLAAETIIVQDGPLGIELIQLIDEFRERLNIISIVIEKNVGLAAALNLGMEKANFEYIVRVDSDDISCPDRIIKQYSFMEDNLDIAASSSFVEEFDDDGQVISIRYLPLKHSDLVGFAKLRNPLSHPAVIFRKSIIQNLGGYPLIYPEDYLMWVLLLKQGFKIANIPSVLVKMRTPDDFLKRRGLTFLKGELRISVIFYKIGFLNFFQLILVISLRIFIRLSPFYFKKILYRFARFAPSSSRRF